MTRLQPPAKFSLTDWRVLGWVAVNVILFGHVVLSQPPLWVTYLYNGILFGIGGILAFYTQTLRRVFTLATVAGVVELGGDYFLVSIAETLVYPQALPMLVQSPLYMPLAWAIVTTQLGYLAIRLDAVYGRVAASVGPAAVATGLIWFYETGAHVAGIWSYAHAPVLMIGNAPAFIIAAEAIMFATLSYFVRRSNPLLAGVGFGLVITASYVGVYGLFAVIAG